MFTITSIIYFIPYFSKYCLEGIFGFILTTNISNMDNLWTNCSRRGCTFTRIFFFLRPAIDGHKYSNIQTSKHSNIYESWLKLDFYLEFSWLNKVFWLSQFYLGWLMFECLDVWMFEWLCPSIAGLNLTGTFFYSLPSSGSCFLMELDHLCSGLEHPVIHHLRVTLLWGF